MVYYDRWGTKLSSTTLFNMISTNLATHKVVQLMYYDRWGTKLSPNTLLNMICTNLGTQKCVQLEYSLMYVISV